jgi:histidinol-phosphate aminotransferase
MSVLDLARPEILALKPYSSARMEAGGAAVMLNANESPWPSTGDAGLDLNRYPDPQPVALRRRLAALYGAREEQLLMGRGSDEAIDLLVRAFCRPGIDAIVACTPTFGMYAVCAAVQGANVVEVPLRDDFGFDAEATLAASTPAVKLVFLCSPNNPTGGLIPLVEIERVAKALEGRALVIVDEAYIEFAEAGSAVTLLEDHANLGVLRTLSKAWALAGARVGVLLAHPDVVALLRKFMPPYPLPTPCVAAALATLDDELAMRDRVARILSERGRMAAAFAARRDVREVLPSRANFLCVHFDDASTVYAAMLAQGVVVRDVGHYRGLAGYLRITVGSAAENTHLLHALDTMQVAA